MDRRSIERAEYVALCAFTVAALASAVAAVMGIAAIGALLGWWS